MSNPMQEFKQTFTKTYDLQGHKFMLRSLSTKESNEIEKEIARKSISLNDDILLSTSS